MKNKLLLFALSISLILITANVSHASERGSPQYGIEKQDASLVVGDALHVVDIVMPVIPGQVPLPNVPFVIGAVPETPSASIKHPPEAVHTEIILYNLLC